MYIFGFKLLLDFDSDFKSTWLILYKKYLSKLWILCMCIFVKFVHFKKNKLKVHGFFVGFGLSKGNRDLHSLSKWDTISLELQGYSFVLCVLITWTTSRGGPRNFGAINKQKFGGQVHNFISKKKLGWKQKNKKEGE